MPQRGNAVVILLVIAMIAIVGGLFYFLTTRPLQSPANNPLGQATSSSGILSSPPPTCDQMEINSLGFEDPPYGASSPVIPTNSSSSEDTSNLVLNDTAGSLTRGVYMVDPTSQKNLWQYTITTSTKSFEGTPAIFGNYVYVVAMEVSPPTDSEGDYYSFWVVYKLDKTTGQFIAKLPLASQIGGIPDLWNECGGYIYFSIGSEGGDGYEYWLERLNPVTSEISTVKVKIGGKP
jgi:hypothetical protein